MKIIHIVEASATGTLAMLSLLANAQSSQGYNIKVIYSVRKETPINFSDHFDPRINLIQIQMLSLKEKIKSIRLIREIYLCESPDAVIMHSSFAGFIGRLAGLTVLPNTSFLYIPHCISFVRSDIGWIKKFIFTCFEWIGAIKRSSYVACSNSERIMISKFIPFRKCYLVENAVKDFPKFNHKPSSTKTIVTVGQIRQQKGPYEYANIAKKIIALNSEIIFRWVGDGDEETKQILIDAGVEITGWVSKDQVIDYLSCSTVYLSTAHWEGMPVSLIEANYANLPVVASACSGNVDVVSHGETGWLFNNETEAVKFIMTALDRPDLSNKVIKNAAREAMHRFNVERYVSDMNSLIVKDLEKRL